MKIVKFYKVVKGRVVLARVRVASKPFSTLPSLAAAENVMRARGFTRERPKGVAVR